MPARYRRIVGYFKKLDDEADEAILIFAGNNRLLGYKGYI